MNKVAVAMFNTVASAVVWLNTILFVPNAIERAVATDDENEPVVKLNPFRVRVPLFSVVVSVAPVLNALPKLHAPPTPSNVTGLLIVTPLVVTVLPVLVELNVTRPVADQTVLELSDIEPEFAIVPVLENVTVPALTVIPKQVRAPVNVTV